MKVCMVVPDERVRGGIAAVVNGYRASTLPNRCQLSFVISYVDGSKLRKMVQSVRAYGAFLYQLIGNRPDVVHIHTSFGGAFWRKMPMILMGKAAGVPIVHHIHGAEFGPFFQDVPRWKQALIRWVYGLCTRTIALSDAWRDCLAQVVPPDTIDVVENFGCVMQGPVQRGGKKVLFLGEIGRRKGCFDLPDIVALVAEKIPEVQFVLCGTGEVETLRKAFAARGLVERVRFPGWVYGEEKTEMLRSADVFLLPSYAEGMPMAVLDALGAALPVVSTKVGGIPPIVREGENGFLCAPGDTQSLADAIVRLLQDEPLRRRMGEAGRNLLETEYSLEKHIDRLLTVYARCLEE